MGDFRRLTKNLMFINCDSLAVVSTRDEPVSGWIDNANGPTGALVAGGFGLMRTFPGDPNLPAANMVPVDMAVSAIIVCAWGVANKPRYGFQ
jgi:fatty acyl-CoA reductase